MYYPSTIEKIKRITRQELHGTQYCADASHEEHGTYRFYNMCGSSWYDDVIVSCIKRYVTIDQEIDNKHLAAIELCAYSKRIKYKIM